MATLTQDIQNRGIILVDPFAKQKELARVKKPTESRVEESKDQSISDERSEELELEEELESEEDVQFEYNQSEEEETAIPATHMKKKKADELSAQLANLSMKDGPTAPIQIVSGSLLYPMISERWEIFDYDTNDTQAFVLMQTVIHTGVNEDDFELNFVKKNTFRIRLRWPKVMQCCMMMTSLAVTTDATGNMFETSPAKLHVSFHGKECKSTQRR